MDTSFVIEQIEIEIENLYSRRESIYQLLDDNWKHICDNRKKLWQLHKGINIGQDVIVDNKFKAKLTDLIVYENDVVVPAVKYYIDNDSKSLELSPIQVLLPSANILMPLSF